MKTVLGVVSLALLSPAIAQAQETVVFVDNGVPKDMKAHGADWKQSGGFIECAGQERFLSANRSIGPGDFRLTAKLSLHNMGHTAASFYIGSTASNLGFDGKDMAPFVQGRFLSDTTQYLPGASGLIQEGEPFEFVVEREGKTTAFSIAGRQLFTTERLPGWISVFGFRPWRSTMRLYDLRVTGNLTPPLPERTQPDNYTIPTIDLAGEKHRQVIVESIPGQYLGHPTTVLLRDKKTILVTYPLGHGGPSAVLKKSTDGGLTWSERLPVPDNWKTARNCPCLHRLTGPDGVERLFVFEGNGAMRQSMSLDNGKTWTPFEPNGLHCVVAPITIMPISGGRLLAHYHRGYGERDRPPLTIWQSISLDGGLTWQPERKVAEYPGADPCEPALIRSPDGKQLISVMRENQRRYNSLLIVSNDEGETWSDPVELPAALTGDRHMPRYAHDGRLVIAMRDTCYGSPTRGDFVAWVGTYDDIVNLREGQYRVRLLAPPRKMDLGYPGLELLPDGTFVATTYAELVKGEKNSVVSVRFTMDELDKKAQQLPRQQAVYISGEDGYHTYRIPAILVSKKGTVLAFCEARKNSGADHGDIDLVVKRSMDGGKTWGPMQTIWDHGEDTVGNPAPVVDRSTGIIWLPFCLNNDKVYVTKSEDDGATWVEPVEITQDVKPEDWTWYATGPVHAIQLKSGRLLVPCDHRVRNEKAQVSHTIYSDDHGATWKLGGVLPPLTDECVAVELVDGSVYLNMRSYAGKHRRAVSRSTDGGITWSDVTLNEALIEPVCQGSAIRYSTEADGGKNRILFSNPASEERIRMTVRVSYDEANTWSDGAVLHAGPSAYSDLAVLSDGTILCLYERGAKRPYETITLARFPLEWVAGDEEGE